VHCNQILKGRHSCKSRNPASSESPWIPSGPGALWAGGPPEFTPYLIRGGNDRQRGFSKSLSDTTCEAISKDVIDVYCFETGFNGISRGL
jgi:hypothetical protein